MCAPTRLSITNWDEPGWPTPHLDLPTGTVTLEVESDGYPTMWHTLPWSVKERQNSRELFMMEKELLTESANRVAKMKIRSDAGSLVGGAQASFFKSGARCVYVQLLDGMGKAVSAKHGPFALAGPASEKTEALCLTQRSPGFSFFNLPAGEYLLKWIDEHGTTFRSHVVYVGMGRISVAVN
jgi:hypothetical protein